MTLTSQMNIIIETRPSFKEMRYPTSGDYFERDGALVFQIAESGNAVYDRLVLIHEMIEQLLCEKAGISNEQIDEWDMAYKEQGEPGDHPKAPYYRQHGIATGIERIIAAELGIDWWDYDSTVARQG